jgi:acetyltransferase
VAASSALLLDDSGDRPSESSLSGHIAALTGLRAFAALNVLLVHGAFLSPYQWAGLHGYGPIALFTLSGFLLFRPFGRWILRRSDPPSLRSFARKRAARIFPAYWLVLLVSAVVLPSSQPSGVREWLHALTLTETFGNAGLNPALFQTWSLGTELGWYVVLPLLAGALYLLARRSTFLLSPLGLALTILAVTGIVTVWWRFLLVEHGWYATWTYPHWVLAYLIAFGSGATLACLLEARGTVVRRALMIATRRPEPLLLIATAAAAIGMSPVGGPHNYDPVTDGQRHVRLACNIIVAALLIAVIVFSPGPHWFSRALGHRSLVALGRWSYGIFLWHMTVILLLDPLLTERRTVGGFLVWIGAILAVSVPLGAATYAWLEQPAIRWSKRPRAGEIPSGEPVVSERTA